MFFNINHFVSDVLDQEQAFVSSESNGKWKYTEGSQNALSVLVMLIKG